MPSQDGKLTPEDIEKFNAWLKAHAPLKCPSCGSESWAAGEVMAYVPLYQPGVITSGAGYPAVLSACTVCGFFRLYSAMIAGLIQADEEKPDAKPEPEEAKHGA